jgi:hypothetical protein
MSAVVTAGGTPIRALTSRPMDDARIEAKLRELAGARADDWLRFASALETVESVSLPD